MTLFNIFLSIFAILLSVIALFFSGWMLIIYMVMKKCTHTIQYVDPLSEAFKLEEKKLNETYNKSASKYAEQPEDEDNF